MEKTTTQDCLFNSSVADLWFEEFIKNIQKDQINLKTGLASKEKEDFYSLLIGGNTTEIIKQTRDFNNRFFISKAVIEYIQLLLENKVATNKLAFDYSNSRVMVWAEISDEKTEDNLILTQAEINAKYQEYGIYLSTTIVDIEDNLSIPSHYKVLKPEIE